MFKRLLERLKFWRKYNNIEAQKYMEHVLDVMYPPEELSKWETQ